MIRSLILLLCVIAWPAAAQECHVPHVKPLNNDDACFCFRDGSILDTESCRARSTPAPSAETPQHCWLSGTNSLTIEVPCDQAYQSATAPTLDEALAACERHQLHAPRETQWEGVTIEQGNGLGHVSGYEMIEIVKIHSKRKGRI